MIRQPSPDIPPGCTCTLHDSIADVPEADWILLVDESRDLAMDRRLIRAQEATLADQCRIWTAVVRDAHGQPVACAMLCLFRVDVVISAVPPIRSVAAWLRRLYPRLLRIGVLFCGLPAPAGANHLRIAPHADADAAIACLHAAMHELATQHRARMMVFKEFDSADRPVAASLQRLSYLAGDIPPLFRMGGVFDDFDAYLSRMRSRYRAQVRRSLRKIEDGGFDVERIAGVDRICQAYGDDLHDLYERTWERSDYKLERLSPAFFRAAAEAAQDDGVLTVIRRRACGTAVGFTFSMSRGDTWHNLYSGVDETVNGEGDILFNLFYADLACAFERGCDEIRLGQTSDAFKIRIGGTPLPLRFFVRGTSSLVHAGMRVFSRWLFPAVEPAPPQRVFSDRPIASSPVSPAAAPEHAVTVAAACE